MSFLGDGTTNIAEWFAKSSPSESDFPELDDSLGNLALSPQNVPSQSAQSSQNFQSTHNAQPLENKLSDLYGDDAEDWPSAKYGRSQPRATEMKRITNESYVRGRIAELNDVYESKNSYGFNNLNETSELHRTSDLFETGRTSNYHEPDNKSLKNQSFSINEPTLSPPPVSSIKLSSPIPLRESPSLAVSAKTDTLVNTNIRYSQDGYPSEVQSKRLDFDDDQWNTILDICDYIDSQQLSFESKSPSLQAQDITKAANSLGFNPPHGSILQFFLQLGNDAPKNGSIPFKRWADAANEIRRLSSEGQHNAFIEKRRTLQAESVAKVEQFLVRRKFLAIWRYATASDIHLVDELLTRYDSLKLTPTYFSRWRIKTERFKKMSLLASSAFNKRQMRAFFAMATEKFEYSSQLASRSKIARTLILQRNLVRNWNDKVKFTKSLHQKVPAFRKRSVFRSVFAHWRQRHRERLGNQRSIRAVQKSEFKKWRTSLNTVDELNKVADSHHQKTILRKWATKAVHNRSINNSATEDLVKDAFRRKFIKLWSYKVNIETFQKATRRVLVKNCFSNWRLQLKTQNCQNLITKIKASELLSHWKSSIHHIQLVERRLSDLQGSIERGIMSTTLAAWEDALLQTQNTEERALSLRHKILINKSLAQVSNSLKLCLANDMRSQDLQNFLLLRKYYSVLKSYSEQERDLRINFLQGEASFSVIRAVSRQLLLRWRHTTNREKTQLSNIDAHISRSRQKFVLAKWSQDLTHLQDAHRTALRVFLRTTQKNVVRQWKHARSVQSDLDQRAEDTEIALLGIFCGTKVRIWQSKLSRVNSRRTEAIEFRKRNERNSVLMILQQWQNRLHANKSISTNGSYDESLEDSKYDTSVNRGIPQSFYNVNNTLNHSSSPSKLSRISPHLISKWKTGGRSFTPSKIVFSPSLQISALRTPITAPSSSRSDGTETPTKLVRPQRRFTANPS